MKDFISGLYPSINFDDHLSLATCGNQFRPLMLVIETVNICNNDCIFCAYSSQTRAKTTMDMAVFKKIVRDYVDMGGGSVSLTPVVGDVFLDKHLVERIKFLRQFPEITSISAVTNAVMTYLRNEEDIDFILKNMNQIFISVYGIDDEEYKTVTKKNTYLKMIEGIRRILNIAEGVVILGFRSLKDWRDDEIQKWIDDVRQGTNYKGQIRYGGTRDYANWSIMDTSKPLPFGARWMPTPNNERQCAIPFFASQVLVNGSVSFCSCPNFDDDSELSLGNIRDDSLLNILNSDRSRRLWDWASNGVPDFCKKCSFHAPVDVMPKIDFVYTDPVSQIGG